MTEAFEAASEAYVAHREKLLKAEIELIEKCDEVAALRRDLPTGPRLVGDYVFHESIADFAAEDPGEIKEVRFADLFAPGTTDLIVFHYMYGDGEDAGPCPMCAMRADGFNGIQRHLRQKTNFVLVAKADVGRIRAWARERGWTNLRLLSSGGTSFNRDFGVEREGGNQTQGVSVFTRDDDGTIRHFCTIGGVVAEANLRGLDLLSPVWNLFDLLPSGRDGWWPSLTYDASDAFPDQERTRDEELAALKRELAQVQKERDFLKEAAAYFARGSK